MEHSLRFLCYDHPIFGCFPIFIPRYGWSLPFLHVLPYHNPNPYWMHRSTAWALNEEKLLRKNPSYQFLTVKLSSKWRDIRKNFILMSSCTILLPWRNCMNAQTCVAAWYLYSWNNGKSVFPTSWMTYWCWYSGIHEKSNISIHNS